MFILTVLGEETEGAYSVQDAEGNRILYLFEAEDDAEMRALYTDGTVDDHCSHNLWNDPDLNYSEYVYEVDGNIVDIWEEKDD